jgi:hypothetical protein
VKTTVLLVRQELGSTAENIDDAGGGNRENSGEDECLFVARGRDVRVIYSRDDSTVRRQLTAVQKCRVRLSLCIGCIVRSTRVKSVKHTRLY